MSEEYAVDVRDGRLGQVMGREGGLVQLRPLGGGREWDCPEDALGEAPPGRCCGRGCDGSTRRRACRDPAPGKGAEPLAYRFPIGSMSTFTGVPQMRSTS